MTLDSDVRWSNWISLYHASYLHFMFVIDLLSISKVIIFYTIATDYIYQNAANNSFTLFCATGGGKVYLLMLMC